MFNERQLQNYAMVMCWALKEARKNGFLPRDTVRLRWGTPAQPLAEEIYPLLIQSGLNVVTSIEDSDRMVKDFYKYASDEQLSSREPWLKNIANSLNGSIYLWAPNDLFYLSDVDPEKQSLCAKAYKPFRDITSRREETGDFGWTLCAWPTMSAATAAGLSLDDYTEEIINACFLNESNPIEEWKKVIKESQRISQKLDEMRITKIYVKSENIDLQLFVGDARRWLGATGHNIPSFEIFTSPHYKSSHGKYFADLPSFRGGNIIENVELYFEKAVGGEVVAYNASQGYEYLKRQLFTDDHARVIGEFSLTDKRFSAINKFMANTLFDENFGGENGNCHIAIGASYLDTFVLDASKLNDELRDQLGFSDSAIHWDLINTEDKIVEVEQSGLKGRTIIYKDGQFVI